MLGWSIVVVMVDGVSGSGWALKGDGARWVAGGSTWGVSLVVRRGEDGR